MMTPPLMTRREQAAFAAGIETARQMALTAAVTIEVRDDAGAVRQHAAAAALQGLAAGLQELMAGATVICIPSAFAGERVEHTAIDSSYDRCVVG